MTNEPPTDTLDPQTRWAIKEIEGLITRWYPTITFAVTQSADPPGIRVLATVDIDDLDEVLDLYIHRLTQLQIEVGLPLSAPSQCRHRSASPDSSSASCRPRAETAGQTSAGSDAGVSGERAAVRWFMPCVHAVLWSVV